MKKNNMNKLMYLMMAGNAVRDNVSIEEAKMISRYLNGWEADSCRQQETV